MDITEESQSTLDLYGIKDVKETTYARNCLLARRLVERGVRFVQLYHEAWDQHGALVSGLEVPCEVVEEYRLRDGSRRKSKPQGGSHCSSCSFPQAAEPLGQVDREGLSRVFKLAVKTVGIPADRLFGTGEQDHQARGGMVIGRKIVERVNGLVLPAP
jgi:hypothetical protein